MFGARTETSYQVSSQTADRIERAIAKHIPRDPYYPTAQPVHTTFVRDPSGVDERKFRVRSYPNSPQVPTFVEFKLTERVDGRKVKTKERIPVPHDFIAQVVRGVPAEEAIGLSSRTGKERDLAQRAVDMLHDGIRPVATQSYSRAAFEAPEGNVRLTIDRDISYRGAGELSAHGTGARSGAIFDVKTIGTPPTWVGELLDAERGALMHVKDGKGATAVADLARRALVAAR